MFQVEDWPYITSVGIFSVSKVRPYQVYHVLEGAKCAIDLFLR